ncbi:MAG: type I-B CRISPR-associated protein Cas7/Cst2/DevR [Chloroflexi bacterium]|nr:type I-B CRISPR-associated protein Cas7/Cst2/DevR [Chloroflexota bacterium]
MSFLTGLILVDAPASALNNAPQAEGARTENVIPVKQIRSREGPYPYVSAQAFRYWLRTTLENTPELEWKAAPVFREKKIAYTDANPLEWWDDDLFGYMRAPSKKTDAVEARGKDKTREVETPTATEITRVSPFRVSTLVSIAPVSIVDDFGTMSRQEGDPVPHEHQFYRTVLKGLFSLDLKSAGTFSYQDRTGFLNLDDARKERAIKDKLEHLETEKSYRLPAPERIRRINALLKGLGILYGGAKQAIHYTDVTPSVLMAMITKGGNNPLHYVITPDGKGLPVVHAEGLEEMAAVWKDQIMSKLYVGWVQGFHDAEREKLKKALDTLSLTKGYSLGHPRKMIDEVVADLAKAENQAWLA